MSKTPSLEEVKKHFENAKVVRCACDGQNYDITKDVVRDVFIDVGNFIIELSNTCVALYFEGKTAEIIECKKQIKDNCVLRKPSPQEVEDYFKDAVTIESISRYNACTFDVYK